MPPDDFIEIGGGWLLIHNQATVDTHRAMRAALNVTSGTDGVQVHARVRRLAEALERQAREVVLTAGVDRAEQMARSNGTGRLSTAEVAVLIGRHERTVTRLAAVLGGHRSGRGWVFDEDRVTSWLEARAMSECPQSDVRR